MSWIRNGGRAVAVFTLDAFAAVATSLVRLSTPGSGGGHGRRILVVRLDEIGDFVLTLPFLEALRATEPFARITLIANPVVSTLAQTRTDLLDEVVSLDVGARSEWSRPLHFVPRAVAFVQAHPHLRGADIAYLPRWGPDLHRAAELSAMLGAQRRLGFAGEGGAAHRRRRRWLTAAIPGGRGLHESERPLGLLGGVGRVRGAPRSPWPGVSRARPADAVRVALAPGAGSRRRVWAPASWARLAEAAVTRWGAEVSIVGGPGDRDLQAAIVAAASVDLVACSGTCSLAEMPAALAGYDLLIGADSGLAHLADAVGTPSVVVSCHPQGADSEHANAPERFAPTFGPSQVVRPPGPASPGCAAGCRLDEPHCILGVDPGAVLAAVARHFEP